VNEGQSSDGSAVVDVSATVSGQRLDSLHIRMRGQPLAGGGVQMSSSRVSLGPSSHPGEYHGVVTALQGTDLAAQLRSASGSALRLVAQLRIDSTGGTVSGTVQVTPGA
jgi:hypothetical protein